MEFAKSQKYISEFIGSFFLVLTVVGSGIMADRLSEIGGQLLSQTIKSKLNPF